MLMRLSGSGSLSLSKKILLPFILFLLILGLTATVGSIHLIRTALNLSLNQRLTESRTQLTLQIKAVEADLLHFSNMLTAIDDRDDDSHSTYHTLAGIMGQIGIEARLVHDNEIQDIEDPQLRQILDHADRSGRSQTRFFGKQDGQPTLAIAKSTGKEDGAPIFLLLKPLKKEIFQPLISTSGYKVFIFDKLGRRLLATDAGQHVPDLTGERLEKAIRGETVITDHPREALRFLVSAVPLGTTDLLLIGVAAPSDELGSLVSRHATRSAITIIIVLLVGGILFFRYLTRLLSPIKELSRATVKVSEGDLDVRVASLPADSTDELGQLAQSFNTMVSQLSDLWQTKADNERKLTLAREELKYKEILEVKNAEIERAHQELRSAFKELSALLQLNQAMTSTLDLNVLFDRMLSVLKELFGCKLILLIYNTGSDALEVRKTMGVDIEVLRDVTFSLDEGVTGKAANLQQLIYIEDMQKERGNLNYKGHFNPKGAMVSSPLVNRNRLCGVLNLHHDEVGGFSDNDLKLIQAVSNQAAIAIENSQLYEKTRSLSNTDELTGLANRRYFQSILQREAAQAQRYQSYFSLLMIDIDHFKQYNDTHGHLKGDVVLRNVANLLLQNTRGIDLVSRFGGEEFVLLLPKTDKPGARAAAEKLCDCIAKTRFEGAVDSQPLGKVTISIGLACYPEDSKDVFELLDLADRSLYRAKDGGRNRVVVWTETQVATAS